MYNHMFLTDCTLTMYMEFLEKCVKDASDKKIIADLLFWEVDNPAPANYLLISGDEDFSNALHQLRMRRYNILLAQPLEASAALVAAAKSVWQWTILVAGGSPLDSEETSRLANGNDAFDPEIPQGSVHDKIRTKQYAHLHPEGNPSSNWKFFKPIEIVNTQDKGKYFLNDSDQPIVTTTSSSNLPVVNQASNNLDHIQQPECAALKQVKRAPHEFFGAREPVIPETRSSPNLFPSNSDHPGNFKNTKTLENHCTHYSHMRPLFTLDNLYQPNSGDNAFSPITQKSDGPRFSSGPPTNVPNNGNLHASGNNNYPRHPPNYFASYVPQKCGTIPLRQPSFDIPNNRYNCTLELSPKLSSSSNTTSINGNYVGRESQLPSKQIQGLIGIVLIALDSLKVEKLIPTEANIKDCIRYGDPKFRNTDVKKALDCALEQKMIVSLNLGAVLLYVGRLDKIWKCVNPIGGYQNQYSKATWDVIENFLASSVSRSAIMASECRYEAAVILKNECLKDHVLGELLQILNIITTEKRWIQQPHSGWQPITITLAEINSETSKENGA